jgi:hypothetical protein
MKHAQIFRIKIKETLSGLIIAESDEDNTFFVSAISQEELRYELPSAIEALFKFNHKQEIEALPIVSNDFIPQTWALISNKNLASVKMI